MRAGAYAEPRVIDLLNRRFVPFYFNRGGPGLGKDEVASAFVNGQTENQWAYFAVFTPEGEYLAETELYADKDEVFEFLLELLAEHPQYAQPNEAEAALLAAGAAEADVATLLNAARLAEELGDYTRARGLCQRVLDGAEEPRGVATAALALARMARFEQRWAELAEHAAFCAAVDEEHDLGLEDAIALELAHRGIAADRFEETRELLQARLRDDPDPASLAALHFSSGRCCWFLGEKELAYYHWCWVCENLPDDPLWRRCYVAAINEGHPYPNPEIRRPGHVGNSCHHGMMDGAYENALRAYEKVRDAQIKEPRS